VTLARMPVSDPLPDTTADPAAGLQGAGRRGRSAAGVVSVLGLLPFFAFVGVFLLWPALSVVRSAVTGDDGVTGEFLGEAMSGQYRRSFEYSIRLSVVTALLGGLVGTALAYAVATLARPRWLRRAMTAWSGVAANLGGVPLAFAFIAALGTQGLVTKLLDGLGLDIIGAGFRISDFWGLVTVYLYFQIPLMVLVMGPAIDGLRPTWREAAANLGASGPAYWRHVAVPILAPSAVGGLLLLFANAFSAYATAYALSSQANIVPLQIRFVLQGNVITGEEDLGFALATWMIVIMAVVVVGNVLLQRRTARWLR
jgi:putative spermidine/putrescine transport system permease protein